MRIYTRTGDEGKTGLIGGERVDKHTPRVEAYGAVDELNGYLGMARVAVQAESLEEPLDAILQHLQQTLFHVGAALADPNSTDEDGDTGSEEVPWGPSGIKQLEQWIDEAQSELPRLNRFVLPGGGQAGSLLHLSRSIARRAERRAVALAAEHPVPAPLLQFLNRLSDLLFVLARLANQRAGASETLWEPEKQLDVTQQLTEDESRDSAG